jgi:hypothetical protein
VLWANYGFRYSAAADPNFAAQVETIALGGSTPDPLRSPGHFPIEYNVRQREAINYLLREHASDDPEIQFEQAEVDKAMSIAPLDVGGRFILFAQRFHLLPEAYLYGFTQVSRSTHRTSFLRGHYSKNGFWNYFLWSFLLKTPLVTLAAIALGVICAVRQRLPRLTLAFLLVPPAVYLLFSMVTRVNIGHRHILPVYPFLFVLCGSLAVEWTRCQVRTRWWTATLTFAAIVVSAFIVWAPPWKPAIVFPHYLAYFNELAGGPRNGYKSLVDSNLDWGQDLKNLKRWLERRNITEPINLCYFGSSDPRFYQFPHLHLPGTFDVAPQVSFDQAKVPGYLAISATNLQGLFFNAAGRAAWQKFLENAKLVDTIGYSIFIYRIESPGL